MTNSLGWLLASLDPVFSHLQNGGGELSASQVIVRITWAPDYEAPNTAIAQCCLACLLLLTL